MGDSGSACIDDADIVDGIGPSAHLEKDILGYPDPSEINNVVAAPTRRHLTQVGHWPK